MVNFEQSVIAHFKGIKWFKKYKISIERLIIVECSLYSNSNRNFPKLFQHLTNLGFSRKLSTTLFVPFNSVSLN